MHSPIQTWTLYVTLYLQHLYLHSGGKLTRMQWTIPQKWSQGCNCHNIATNRMHSVVNWMNLLLLCWDFASFISCTLLPHHHLHCMHFTDFLLFNELIYVSSWEGSYWIFVPELTMDGWICASLLLIWSQLVRHIGWSNDDLFYYGNKWWRGHSQVKSTFDDLKASFHSCLFHFWSKLNERFVLLVEILNRVLTDRKHSLSHFLPSYSFIQGRTRSSLNLRRQQTNNQEIGWMDDTDFLLRPLLCHTFVHYLFLGFDYVTFP